MRNVGQRPRLAATTTNCSKAEPPIHVRQRSKLALALLSVRYASARRSTNTRWSRCVAASQRRSERAGERVKKKMIPFMLRLGQGTHAMAKQFAAREGVSLNSWITHQILWGFAHDAELRLFSTTSGNPARSKGKRRAKVSARKVHHDQAMAPRMDQSRT